MNLKNYSKGFSLVEAVIVSSIAAGFILVLSTVNTSYLNYASSESERVQAGFLAEETIEAARYLRDKSWTANIAGLTAGQDYYLYWSGTAWSATTTMQTPSPFYRKVKFDNVYRDASDNIAGSGTLDAGTKLVTATIAWSVKGATTTKTLQTYITNVFSN